MNKSRHIIGEFQEFTANNDAGKAINSMSTIMNNIRIQGTVIRELTQNEDSNRPSRFSFRAAPLIVTKE